MAGILTLRLISRSALLCVLLSCGAGYAADTQKAAKKKEPVVQFDFEKGAKGWIGYYDAPKTVQVKGARGKSCMVLKTDKTVTREYQSPMFPVTSTKKYKVSMLVRVDKFGKGYSPLTVNIRWFLKPKEQFALGGWNLVRIMPNDKEKTFGWKRVEVVVEAPHRKWMHGPITHGCIQVRNYRTVGTAYVDDIKVELADDKAKAVNSASRTGV